MKLLHSQKKLKTSILILFFFVFSMNCAMADPCTGNVTIPDTNFKTALLAIDGIDANGDEEIQCSEASAYTDTIDVSSQGIAYLTGIEAFTNITSLNCNNNSLTSLDVSLNTALTYLDCSNNSLSTLDVSLNTALQTLNCNYNSLTSLDVATALNILYCSNNQLSSLNTSGVAALTELHCAYNQLASLDISTNTVLTALGCSNNLLTSLVVSGNTDLSLLHCQYNSLPTLDVSANTVLTQLRCQYNQLTNLNTTGVTTLNELRCANNQLASLDISTNTALTLLGCANNQLSSLDVSANTALTILHCPYNLLTSLDVSTNKAIASLYCYNNSLRSLNVQNTNNSILTDFNATSNPDLTCIQVDDASWSTDNWLNIDAVASYNEVCTVNIPDEYFKAALVENLSINSNADTEIEYDEATAYTGGITVISQNISDLTGIEAFQNITSLNCSNNLLTSLNVSNNTDLTSLTCNNNSLMTLDVSANRALTVLYCNDNQLTSLNVKNTNNSNLTNFNATNNPNLTCIQVDNAAWSTTNWTNKDAGASYNEVCGWSTVNIPDANFKAALVDDPSINTSGDTEIQYDEAITYTGGITVSSMGIEHLTGIEAFTNITSLDCSDNSLTTLDVSANTVLEYLECSGNLLTSLDVSSNTALTYLSCRNNQLSSLNTSDVAALTELHCAYNQLASFDISTNTALTALGCSNNLLTSLVVSGNIYLSKLHCQNNQITSLDVSANTALISLYCSSNLLTSLNVKNGNNTSLDFNATSNPDLTCIQVDNAAYSTDYWTDAYDGLESFSTDCACIVNILDINFKNALVGNTDININGDGKIQCFEASAYTGTIDVSSQSISDLTGIEAFTNITSLNCNNNSLEGLDVSSNKALEDLYCNTNSLTSLDVSGLTSLYQIYCYENSLSTLDVSSNTALQTLYCNNNLLTSLNVFGLTSLYEISCYENHLSTLDVSSNTAIEYLNCNNNLLSSLNVKNRNNSSIYDFNATGNPSLSCIQVDDVDDGSTDSWSKDTGASFNEFCGWSKVNIPDANFKSALLLIEGLDANSDRDIQYDEATAYTGVIIVSGLSIANLKGIEAFINITSLDCSNNSLTSLNVSNNTALIALYCNNNHLRSLNVKNGNNTSLTNFNATNNPNLSCIQVDNAAYSTANWANIDGLESFNEVCSVNIPDDAFKAALVGNGIDINGDSEIQYDEASAYAGSISVNSQSITDLTGIEAFTNITYLDCSYNLLTSLDVSANTALEFLSCKNNQLLSLNTTSVTALTELHCAYNQLASLDISTNTALTTLGCSNNLLTSLVVSDNTDLSKLHCQYNQITSLDVSGLTSLYEIYCYENQLSTLNVSSNTALQYLYCYNNSLTSLNVSSNTVLEYLYCNNNSLTSLNVKNGNNNNLSDFDATSNPDLTCIQVDDAAWSTDYWPNKDAGASYSTTDCGANLIWTGATDTDWGTANNWDNGFVPSVSNNITIPDVTNGPIATSITVGAGKVLTINPAGYLTINGTLTNNGTVAIKSDATGTGSLIVASVSGSGTASAERYMTGNIWHMVSPITVGDSVSTFIQATGNAIALSGSNYGMMDYNETTNTWNTYYDATTPDTLSSGKGYSVRRTSDGIVTFTGELTSGTKSVPLSMGGMGWNCIGNPYTSAINMNNAANGTYNFLKSNSSALDGSYACMYVWDDATLSYKILGNTNYGGRDLGQNIFQSGQGFFVKAASDGVIVEFNNNMQVYQTGAMFKAPASKTSWPGITLTATSTATSSSAIITFNENMTKGLDPTYDAGMLRGTNGLSLYTRLLEDNGVDFAVQCLPENYSNLVIPVGVDCRDGGEITFSAETVDLPTDCNVILEDRSTKTYTSLADGATYKTTVLAGSTAVGRFYIRTGDNFTTGTSGLTAGISSLKAYNVNGTIIIEGEVNDQAIATLYDLQGLKVLVHSLQKGSLNILSCPDLINGIYLLTIQQDGEIVTRKLIMK